MTAPKTYRGITPRWGWFATFALGCALSGCIADTADTDDVNGDEEGWVTHPGDVVLAAEGPGAVVPPIDAGTALPLSPRAPEDERSSSRREGGGAEVVAPETPDAPPGDATSPTVDASGPPSPGPPLLTPFVEVVAATPHTVTLQVSTDVATSATFDYDLGAWPKTVASNSVSTVHSVTLDRMMSGDMHAVTIGLTHAPSSQTIDVATTIPTVAYADAGLPPGWGTDDIGSVGLAGSAIYDAGAFGGAYAVRATGTDVFFDEDSFHFVHHPVSGDFTLTVRVEGYAGYLHMWTKALTMFRASTAANAAFFTQSLNYSGYDFLYYRPSTGAQHTLVSNAQLQPAAGAALWLRLQRVGDTFTELSSHDGVTWTPHGPAGGTVVALPSTGLVGFGVCSKSNAYLSEIVFSNVTLTQP